MQNLPHLHQSLAKKSRLRWVWVYVATYVWCLNCLICFDWSHQVVCTRSILIKSVSLRSSVSPGGSSCTRTAFVSWVGLNNVLFCVFTEKHYLFIRAKVNLLLAIQLPHKIWMPLDICDTYNHTNTIRYKSKMKIKQKSLRYSILHSCFFK